MELRLPSEFQEVEYIENTGTQYIITDLLFPKDLENPKIEWGFMQIAVPSGDNMVFGYSDNGAIYYESYNSTTLIYSAIGQKRYRGISNSNLTRDMIITGLMTKDNLFLNEYSYTSNAEYTITQSVFPMAIFAWKTTSGVNYINKGARIYYLRFYDGNTKMANYVPCYRKSDGEIGMYDTVTKTFYTNSGTGTFLKGADVTRYIDNVSVLDTRRKILLNTPHIDTSVGDLVTFNTDLSAPLKSCKVSFLPVQGGSGDPSPENERSIFGFTECEVQRTRKNLVNPDDCLIGKYINSNGEMRSDANWTIADYIACKPNTTYTITGSTIQSNSPSAQLAFYDKEKNLIELRPAGKSNLTFKTPNGCAFMRLSIRNANVDEIQVEVGDTATDYEPYTGQTYSITFPTEAGTVYGGYVDLVSGELVQEWYGFTADGENVKVNSQYTQDAYDTFGAGIVYNTPRGEPYHTNVLCEALPVHSSNSAVQSIPNIYVPRNGQLYMIFYIAKISEHPEITTSAEKINYVNNWLKENPQHIVYKLTTPIHYQLTPQQLTALRGTNNIYSNTNGQTEIKYWKH